MTRSPVIFGTARRNLGTARSNLATVPYQNYRRNFWYTVILVRPYALGFFLGISILPVLFSFYTGPRENGTNTSFNFEIHVGIGSVICITLFHQKSRSAFDESCMRKPISLAIYLSRSPSKRKKLDLLFWGTLNRCTSE